MSSTQDHIFIDGFEVSCQIGDSEAERAFPQVVEISMQIYLPLQKAGQNEDMNASVDYAQIIEKVAEGVKNKTFILQEGLAEWIWEGVLKNYEIDSASIKVSKKNFPGIKRIGVCLVRDKR